ncbi:MAG: DUF2000 family protein [bacterium]|nr:DUF2000 family protein [bacterium]
MKRVAIVLEKNLSPGAIGNASAILMGQAALNAPEIYSSQAVLDKDGTRHAGIQYSTIVLKAGAGQLVHLIQQAREQSSAVGCVAFTSIGQGLHNQFEEYKNQLSTKGTADSAPVGVIVYGNEDEVKLLTKKFSLLQ